MPSLSDTIAQLARLRRGTGDAGPGTALQELPATHAGPGALRMLCHVPANLPAGAPLVVVLHGCTQSAAAYDAGAGWSALADRHGFAVLYPEQTRANNANLCFNWFQPEDTGRTGGEVQQIREAIARIVALHKLDPHRVHVTGLSAGGAMAAAMLAAYPEVFAGGAIIAGLPYGAAGSVQSAFEAMFQGRTRTPHHWGDLVRAASPHRGPWPRVQIWHGTADQTVKPSNAEELAKQWANVLGLPAAPDVVDVVDGAAHRAWRDAGGRTALEVYLVPGLAHGTPLDTGHADLDHAAGRAGPHMLEAGISSTWHIAQSWGLLTAAPAQAAARPAEAPRAAGPLPKIVRPLLDALPAAARTAPAAVIDKALKAAGLLR